jgi:hypothetical protein
MSDLSTSQIIEDMHGWSGLTAEFRALFETFEGRMDALSNTLLSKVYINSQAGDDEALGGETTPVQTLAEAVSRIPAGAFGTIVMKTSVTVAEKIDTRARGLLFEAYPTVDAALRSDWWVGEDGLQYPGQINFAGSYGSVGFNGVGLHFEERPAGTRGDIYACGVFVTNSLTPPLFCGFFQCAITRDAGADAFLIAGSSDTSTLNVATSVTYSSAMNGYWFAGVLAGTARTSTRHNTNITSL